MHSNPNLVNSNYVAVGVATLTPYSNLKPKPIIVLSSFNILFWIAISTITAYEFGRLYTQYYQYYVPWEAVYQMAAATDYLVVGSLGLSAARKRTHALVVSTVTFTIFSIFSAIGMIIYNIELNDSYYVFGFGQTLKTLRWCCVGLNATALMFNLVLLILLAIAIRRRNKVPTIVTTAVPVNRPVAPSQYNQQYNLQPIYSQPQQAIYSQPYQAIYSQPQQAIYSQPQQNQHPFASTAPPYIPRNGPPQYQVLSADRLQYKGNFVNTSNIYN